MQDSSYATRLQRLAVVPGHPLRGVGRQFPGMFRLALGADTLTRSLAERICNSCV